MIGLYKGCDAGGQQRCKDWYQTVSCRRMSGEGNQEEIHERKSVVVFEELLQLSLLLRPVVMLNHHAI